MADTTALGPFFLDGCYFRVIVRRLVKEKGELFAALSWFTASFRECFRKLRRYFKITVDPMQNDRRYISYTFTFRFDGGSSEVSFLDNVFSEMDCENDCRTFKYPICNTFKDTFSGFEIRTNCPRWYSTYLQILSKHIFNIL